MKTPLPTARRWLAQAEHDLVMTRALADGGFWSGTCFHAEQTALLGLKAFLFWRGRRSVTLRPLQSVRVLAQECAKEDADFTPRADCGIVLDRYYLSTRYPDVLPEPAIPFQTFTRRDAREALDYATEIVQLVRAKIPTQ
jgi:HEPN domain-containing protein